MMSAAHRGEPGAPPAPAARPFLRKGAHKQRYDPQAVRERIGARLEAKARSDTSAAAAAMRAATPQPRGADGAQRRLTPLSDAATANREAFAPMRAQRKPPQPPQPPLAERFVAAYDDSEELRGQENIPPAGSAMRARGRPSDANSIAEFEALEQLVHTEHSPGVPGGRARGGLRDDWAVLSPPRRGPQATSNTITSAAATPERVVAASTQRARGESELAWPADAPHGAAAGEAAAAAEVGADGEADEFSRLNEPSEFRRLHEASDDAAAEAGGSQWWDALYSDLQMQLPVSPAKEGADGDGGASGVGARAAPPRRGVAGPSAALPSSQQQPPSAVLSEQPPPTSRLVASLFHANHHHQPRQPAQPRGGRSAAAGGAAAPRCAPTAADVRAGGGGAALGPTEPRGADADTPADALQREREAAATERLRLVRLRTRAQAAHAQLAARAKEADQRAEEAAKDRAALAEERRQFEQWREEETGRLAKERRQLERQARMLLKLPDREERREVSQLRAEMAAAADAAAQRDAKAKLALERLRRQLAAEQAEKEELVREVRLLSSAAAMAAASAAGATPRAGGKARARPAEPQQQLLPPPPSVAEEEEQQAGVGARGGELHGTGSHAANGGPCDVRALIKQPQWAPAEPPPPRATEPAKDFGSAAAIAAGPGRAHGGGHHEAALAYDADAQQNRPSKRLTGGLFHSPLLAPAARAADGAMSFGFAPAYSHQAYTYEQPQHAPHQQPQPALPKPPVAAIVVASVYGDSRPALAPTGGNGAEHPLQRRYDQQW